MKVFKLDYRKRNEIKDWLTLNVSPDGYRWWFSSVHNEEGTRDLLVNLDLTEQEEEEFLTVFLLSNL
jgi:hypothetical protein